MPRDQDGEGWMRVGPDRGTRGGRAEPWTVHTVHGRARVHGGEDGVGQIGENNGESSRRTVRRALANDSKTSRLGGRSDTRQHQRFDQFDLKTGESVTSCGGVREGLTDLTLKPRATGLTGLGVKTGYGLGAVMVWTEDTWRHHEACVKAKRSREGSVSVRCSE